MSTLAQEIPRIVDFESLPTGISVNFNNNLSMEIARGRELLLDEIGGSLKNRFDKTGAGYFEALWIFPEDTFASTIQPGNGIG